MINHYTIDMKNPRFWDEYFYNTSKVIASNSKCLSRKIGAIIVLGHTIISTGYNGPPKKVRRCDERWLVDEDMRIKAGLQTKGTNPDENELKKLYINKLYGKCPRYISEMGFKSGQGLEWCVAGHAERNAIVNAARHGLHALKGTSIYMTCGVPCTPCLVEIINAGIKEIVVTAIKGAFYDQSSKYLLKESKIKIRTYDFIKNEDSIDIKGK